MGNQSRFDRPALARRDAEARQIAGDIRAKMMELEVIEKFRGRYFETNFPPIPDEIVKRAITARESYYSENAYIKSLQQCLADVIKRDKAVRMELSVYDAYNHGF